MRIRDIWNRFDETAARVLILVVGTIALTLSAFAQLPQPKATPRPAKVQDHSKLAKLYRQKGQFQKAIAEYQKAADYNTMDPDPAIQIQMLREEQEAGRLTVASDRKYSRIIDTVDKAFEDYEAMNKAWKNGMSEKQDKTEAEEKAICQNYNDAGRIIEKVEAIFEQMAKNKMGTYQLGLRLLAEIKGFRGTTLAPPFCL